MYTQGLEIADRIYYDGEGWGLSFNDDMFVMSNGTEQIYLRNKNDFSINQIIIVKSNNSLSLNDIEYYDGYIYANNYPENKILKINIEREIVEEVYNLDSLVLKAKELSNSFGFGN